MKNTIIAIAILSTAILSCNNSDKKNPEKNNDTAQAINKPAIIANAPVNSAAKVDVAIKEMVIQYLAMKNALANDNGKDAASAGRAFAEALGKMDKNSLAPGEKKVWEDVADDAKEMAEHIGKNADRIEHQREHFDGLSQDMYDMVKEFGAGQTLYQDFCPMYNDNKGAGWLSETKEITNPYFGKKMPTCGSIKEEIK